MRRIVWWVMAVSLVTLGGCSAEPADPGSGRTLEERVGFTSDRWLALLERGETAIAACMTERGHRYVPQDFAVEQGDGPHGLFGIATPAAVTEFLGIHGYGAARRLEVLRLTTERHAAGTTEAYYDTLGRKAKRQFEKDLTGSRRSEGCLARAGAAARLGLPAGGDMGDAYGRRIMELHGSDEYRDYEKAVLTCLAERGVAVRGDSLDAQGGPFLRRMVALAGGELDDGDGTLSYSIKASQLPRGIGAELARLRRDEIAAAAPERSCRLREEGRLRPLLVAAGDQVVDDFPEEFRVLREALSQASPEGVRESKR